MKNNIKNEIKAIILTIVITSPILLLVIFCFTTFGNYNDAWLNLGVIFMFSYSLLTLIKIFPDAFITIDWGKKR